MTVRIAALAAALIATAASALAQGLDSARSPYPRGAYAAALTAPTSGTTHSAPVGYRYAGQHAGGPANDLARR